MAHTRRSTWCSLRTLGPELRWAIVARGGGFCAWCDCALDQFTAQIDHFVPRSRWPRGAPGRDAATNLVPACSDCNNGGRPEHAPPSLLAQLADPIGPYLWIGRELARVYYPTWMDARLVDRRRRKKESAGRAAVANREARAAGLGATAFPFGAAA